MDGDGTMGANASVNVNVERRQHGHHLNVPYARLFDDEGDDDGPGRADGYRSSSSSSAPSGSSSSIDAPSCSV